MIVEMKKISLSGPKAQLREMVDALKSTGVFEQSNFKKQNIKAETNSEEREQLAALLARTKAVLEFAEKNQREFTESIKKHKLSGNKIEGFEDVSVTKNKTLFSDTIELEYQQLKDILSQKTDIINLIETLENASARLYEIKGHIAKNKAIIADVKPYINLNVSFNLLHDTESAFILAGIISKTSLEKFKSDFNTSSVIIEEFDSGSSAAVVLIGHGDDYPIIHPIYDYGFERCKFNYYQTAKEKITELEDQNANFYYENLNLLYKSCLNAEQVKMLKIYYDYLQNELDTENILSGTLQTEKIYIMSGWFIAKEEKRLERIIKSVSGDVQLKIETPGENDNPPSLVKNRSLIAPYESVTNMYGMPSKKDLDPNTFVAFFYFLFFGIMIGDLGYGLVMFVASIIVLQFFKPKKGTKDLILIICMGGLSAILWGFFFGSVFGLSKTGSNGAATTLLPGVIDPINDSLMFLVFTLALGVVQLVFGLILKFINLVRHKKVLDAICDAGFRITLFIGLIFFALGFAVDSASVLSTPGIIIAATSLALIFLTAGRKNQGILGKLSGGFGGVYTLINYFSDILSYTRLFGLGLVGAVIAMVANTMAEMMFGIPIVGIPIGIIVALFFHAFNLALGLLSAYVHNARLQFVEFFGKFYEGEGNAFTPLGSNTKYIKIKPNLKEEK